MYLIILVSTWPLVMGCGGKADEQTHPKENVQAKTPVPFAKAEPKRESRPPAPPATPDSLQKHEAASGSVAISAEELSKEVAVNEKTADAKYKNKSLEVQGFVESALKTPGSGEAIALLEGAPAGGKLLRIRCTFSSGSQAKALVLTRGQKIKVKGSFQVNSGFLDLAECDLLDAAEPEKPASWESLQPEIDVAGKDVKLVKLDFGPEIPDLVMEAPHGARVNVSLGDITVHSDHFTLQIALGRREFAARRHDLQNGRVVVEGKDFILARDGAGSFSFGMVRDLGHVEYFVQNPLFADGKIRPASRQDSMLALNCARTLAFKTPLPKDPGEILARLNAQVERDGMQKITRVMFAYESKASDATLRVFTNLPDVREVWLPFTRITDEGLAHLARLSNLKRLNLANTSVGDEGVSHLKGLTSLEALDLSGTAVSDHGLAALKGLRNLQDLKLRCDALSSSSVTDAGLRSVGELKALKTLQLPGASITDAGLARLQGLADLEDLDVSGFPSGNMKLTDAGLSHLKSLSKLRVLKVKHTAVTEAGVKDLQKARPDLKVEH